MLIEISFLALALIATVRIGTIQDRRRARLYVQQPKKDNAEMAFDYYLSRLPMCEDEKSLETMWQSILTYGAYHQTMMHPHIDYYIDKLDSAYRGQKNVLSIAEIQMEKKD